jgi:2-iminobutanoate/2-iminopropanoate deaminase
MKICDPSISEQAKQFHIPLKNKYYLHMKKIIFTEKAPAPIGPYNQAVLVGNTLYTSGQIAINPATGELVTSNIEAETTQVMENMKAVLEAAGMTFENVVKSTIFIMNMGDFGAINTVYGSYFNEKTAPARETVQVACLPKNLNIEISMIAIL